MATQNKGTPNEITETDIFLLSENKEISSDNEPPTTRCPCVQKPEGRDAWVIAFAGMCVTLCVSTEFAAFGIYYVGYTDLFGVSKAAVGWIKGLQTISGGLVSILAGTFIKVFGCRTMIAWGGICLFLGMFLGSFSPNIYVSYLTHGVLLGVGLSLTNMSVAVCIQQHFIRNKVLGAGISNFGYTLGGLFFPIVASHLMEAFGLKGALRVHSAILANVVPFGLLLRAPKSRRTDRHPKITLSSQIKKELFDFSLLKDPLVVCFLVASVLTYYNVNTFVSHLAGRAMFNGASRQVAAYLQSSISIASCFARILTTVLGNLNSVNEILVYGLGLVLISTASILYGLFNSFELAIVSATLFGIGMGALTTVSNVVYVRLFTLERLPKFLGFFTLASFIGLSFGPPMSGLIFDATLDYDLPFYLAGSLSMVSAAVVLAIVVVDHRRRSRHKENTIT